MTEPSQPDTTRQPDTTGRALHRVIVLLMANLGLSAVLTILVLVFRNQLLDYQVSHTVLPAGVDPATYRAGLGMQVWVRAGGLLLLSLVYVYLVRRLRAGHRRAYIRVIVLSAVGFVSLVVVVFTRTYPVWVRAEQALQACVLLALLWAVTRPEIRQRFAKPTVLTSP